MSSGRILVVEDDAALAELLRVHLANAGYEVVLAEDAVAAARPCCARRRRWISVVRQVAAHAG